MTTVAERWQHRFLNSGKGLAACLLLALVWVLLEKAAVNHVSRPTDVDTFHARDYFNSDLTWRSKRFFELTRNLSVPLPGARARAAGRPIEQTIRDLQQLERHGKALATTSLQLQADLLAAEAHISVLKSRIALGENRDILHSMWFKYCWKPGKTRICDADSVLRPIINLQAPPVVFAVYGTLVCFLAATSAGEFVVANHMILTILLSRLFRTVTFLSTTLAPLNPNCRVIFRGASESGGCGDLLFSGHGTVVTSAACLVWTQTQPRAPLVWKVLVTIWAVHSMWASSVERFHYTADMVLASIVTVLVFLVLDPVTGYSQRRSTRIPAAIQLKHVIVPLIVAPLLYLALHYLGVLH